MQSEIKCDNNIRFVDSVSFTLMSLKDFPKTFGLIELAKTLFSTQVQHRRNVGCHTTKTAKIKRR